jgi:hypothetical protein
MHLSVNGLGAGDNPLTPRQQILLLDFLKSGKMGVLLCWH